MGGEKPPPKHTGAWTTGLCDCFGDLGTCCYGFWCYPCAYGTMASRVEERDSCCVNCFLFYVLHMFCCCACLAKQKRKDMRAKYDLPHGGCCGDFAVHCFCGPCAVCQGIREMNNRAKSPGGGAQFVTQAPPAQVMV